MQDFRSRHGRRVASRTLAASVMTVISAPVFEVCPKLTPNPGDSQEDESRDVNRLGLNVAQQVQQQRKIL